MEKQIAASTLIKAAALKMPQLIETRRASRSLMLANPNYFGNLKSSKYPAVYSIVADTTFEELVCIGFSPDRSEVNAVVEVKLPNGYGGDLCQPGSKEFVRFFVDRGSGWQDAGVAGFEVHDVANGKDCAGQATKPLSYTVGVTLNVESDCCFEPVLPRVRAILAWNVVPPVDPNWSPIWGNHLDGSVQLKPINSLWCLIKQLPVGAYEKLNVPPLVLESAVKPIPLPDPAPLAVAELAALYGAGGAKKAKADLEVLAHRFGASELHAALSNTAMSAEALDTQSAAWKAAGLDWASAITTLDKTNGDVSYEELDCLALDPGHEWLVATFTIKRKTGYSGDLCTHGSTEYVAFWADWADTCDWGYLGTAEVQVHDIDSIPADGLHYMALIRVPANEHRPCQETRPSRVRAVLSWATAPSSTDPDAVPYWGNRLDSHVVVTPSAAGPQPIIRSLGSVPISKIDPVTGLTTVDAFFEFLLSPTDDAVPQRPCPFGLRVAVKGPSFLGQYYRLQVKRQADPTTSWTPLKTPLKIEDITGNVITPWPPYNSDGFFKYADPNLNAEDLLGEWDTTGDELWEIMLELATAPDAAHVTNSVVKRLQLDNSGPEVDIHIASGGDCKDFNEGTLMNGNFVARHQYFGSYSLGTLPFGAPAGQLIPVGGTTQTAPAPGGDAWSLDTHNMQPCGYVLQVTAWDLAILNSSPIHHSASEAVGFCVRAPLPQP